MTDHSQAHGPHDSADGDSTQVVRWGVYSIAVNLVLIALHGLIVFVSAIPSQQASHRAQLPPLSRNGRTAGAST